MGGRRGPSAKQMGGGGSGGRAKGSSGGRGSGTAGSFNLEQELISGTAKSVTMTAFKTVAGTHPFVSTLYAAYEAAKFSYPIFKEGVREFRETKDGKSALKAMGKETVRQVGKSIKDFAIDNIAGSLVNHAIAMGKINLPGNTESLVRNAVSESLKGFAG